jgi:hypothetical protein
VKCKIEEEMKKKLESIPIGSNCDGSSFMIIHED